MVYKNILPHNRILCWVLSIILYIPIIPLLIIGINTVETPKLIIAVFTYSIFPSAWTFCCLWEYQTVYLTDDSIRLSNPFSKNISTLYYKDCWIQKIMLKPEKGSIKTLWIAIYKKEKGVWMFSNNPFNFSQPKERIGMQYNKKVWEFLCTKFPEEDIQIVD
jgi:hypothetical protein